MPASGPVGRFARKKSSSPNFVQQLSKALCSKNKKPIANKIESRELALWLMLVYYWAGSMLYTRWLEPEWTTTESLYFLTATMTTVGYGDIIPTNRTSRYFTIFWALFGVCVVAVALVEVAGLIMDARDAIVAETRAALLRAGDGSNSAAVSPAVLAKMKAMEDKKSGAKSNNPIERVFQLFPVLEVVLYMTIYTVAFGNLFAYLENWSFADGVYFAVISGTSIGYGDVSPVTSTGRFLSILYIPFAVVFVSTQLGEVPDKLFGSGDGNDKKLEKLMSADLSLEGILAMDKDGDGSVDQYEFLRHMLTQADIIDGSILDSLHARFQAMDEDGSGCLTADDLKVEPLGLKLTCNATDVSNKALAWPRAVLEASSSASPKWGRSNSGSSFRRGSLSPHTFGFGRKSLLPPLPPSPSPLSSPAPPPPPSTLQRSPTLSGPDVDALLVAAAVDDVSSSVKRHMNNSVDAEESPLLNFAKEAPKRNSSLPKPKSKSTASSPRNHSRFVDDNKTEISSGSRYHEKAKTEVAAKKSAIKRIAKPKQASPPNILKVEIEEPATDSKSKSRSVSRSSSNSNYARSNSSRNSSRATSPKAPSSSAPPSRRPSGSDLSSSGATGNTPKGSSRASSSTSSRGRDTKTSAKSTTTGVSPRPEPRTATQVVSADALSAAVSADDEIPAI